MTTIEDRQAPASLAPTSLPCPSWCTTQTGHGFEQLDLPDSWARHHERWFGDDLVSVSALEHASSNEGPSKVFSPEITVPEVDTMTVDESMELLQALVDATRFVLTETGSEAER